MKTTARALCLCLLLQAALIEARSELKDARRKSVRLTVQDGERTREVVVKLRDLV